MVVRLHVEPSMLKLRRPALVIAPDGGNHWPNATGVTIRCQACGCAAARLVQVEDQAHVVVATGEALEVDEPMVTPR